MSGEQTVDLYDVIEHQKIGGFLIKLVVVSWIVTFFDGFDINGIAFAAPYMSSALHLSKIMMGNVFSIGLLGTMIGGFAFGIICDWIGRRPAIILSTASFGVLTALVAFSQNYEQLLVLRLLDGIAMGGMLPLGWALNIEYAPKRYRATIVTIIMIGYAAGVSASGPVTLWLVPDYGWPALFLFGAGGAFVGTALLYLMLPESIRFLAVKGRGRDTIAAIVRRIAPERQITPSTRFVLTDSAEQSGEGAQGLRRIAKLFEGELRGITIWLWVAYIASSVAVFFGTSWFPTMLESVGFQNSTVEIVVPIITLGGMIGALFLMRFIDKYGAIAISVMPAFAVPVLIVLALVPVAPMVFLLLIFVSWTLQVSPHTGLHSVAGIFYPSAVRGTGAGWAISVAKIGSVIGPIVGGILLSTNMPVRHVFGLTAVCPVAVCFCTLMLGRLHSRMLARERMNDAAAMDPILTPPTAPIQDSSEATLNLRGA